VTIEKGAPYGEPGVGLAAGGVICRSDAEARAAVEDARRRSLDPPALGLLGGDLCRTLGGTATDPNALAGPTAATFPVDLGEVLLDGRYRCFVAHLVVRRRLWAGRTIVAANAQWLGEWNVAPRGHPNDGVLDCFDSALRLADLRPIRSRLPTGSHLPHPRIEHRRTAAWTVELDRRMAIRLDGDLVGQAGTLAIRCRPDALRVTIA
jgi:hypothetical protein